MTNEITVPYGFTPRTYQLDFYKAMDSGKKRAFKRWTRRAGKDICDWNFMIKMAFSRIGNYYYIFPSYTQGKKALWEGKTKDEKRYLDYIPPGWAKFNSNEMRIELKNGSIIRIAGSDNIDSLRGPGACGIVLSEFAWQSMEVIEVLEPMLLENNGWLVINSTPNGKNHMYDLEQQIKTNKEWYVSVIQSLWPDLPDYYPVMSSVELDKEYSDGKISTEQFLERAKQYTSAGIESARTRGATEEKIEQEYGVSYVAGQNGSFYMDCITKARNDNRIGTFCHNDQKYVDTFWDLGLTDDTAVWFRQVDGNRLIWIDYYENNGKPLVHYAQMLKEKNYRFRTHYFPHDGRSRTLQTGISNKQLFERLLEEAGISSDIFVANRVSELQIAISLVRERFSRYYFNEPKCADGLTKLSLYHREYDKQNKCFRDTPKHDWTSHAASAIAVDGATADVNESYAIRQDAGRIITDFNPLTYGE